MKYIFDSKEKKRTQRTDRQNEFLQIRYGFLQIHYQLIKYDGLLLKVLGYIQELKEVNVWKATVGRIMLKGHQSFVTVRNGSYKFVFLKEGLGVAGIGI